MKDIDKDHSNAIKEAKFQRNRIALLFILYVPIMFLIFYLLKMLGCNAEKIPMLSMAFAYMLFMIYCVIKLMLVKCPECGKHYTFNYGYRSNPFSEKCVHCGFKIIR
jgi:hypothetical protein